MIDFEKFTIHELRPLFDEYKNNFCMEDYKPIIDSWELLYLTEELFRRLEEQEKKCRNNGRCQEIGNGGIYCPECDGKWG